MIELVHADTPPSLNSFVSGGGGGRIPWRYVKAKQAWEGIFWALLHEAGRRGLPRKCSRVVATADITFAGPRRRRDEGNYRFLIEKCLGDALTKGGWLPDDTPEFFSFGKVTISHGEQAKTVVRIEASPLVD